MPVAALWRAASPRQPRPRLGRGAPGHINFSHITRGRALRCLARRRRYTTYSSACSAPSWCPNSFVSFVVLSPFAAGKWVTADVPFKVASVSPTALLFVAYTTVAPSPKWISRVCLKNTI